MPTKKKIVNAFSIFLDEKKLEYPNITKKELAAIHHNEYKDLPENMKQIYQTKAKAAKNSMEKCDSFGNPIRFIEEAENQMKTKRINMEKSVASIVKELSSSSSDLIDHYFCNIYISYYIHTDEDIYLPAEISVCKFSLKDGVVDTYHNVFIPAIKAGYKYEAMAHSTKTHQLFQSSDAVQKDCLTVIKELMDFCKSLEKPIILYTMDDQINIVETILSNELMEANEMLKLERSSAANFEFNKFDPEMFRIYSMEFLYWKIYNQVRGSTSVYIPLTIARDHLKSSTFEFMVTLCCNWHRKSKPDACNHCSMTYLKKWIYNMFNNIQLFRWLKVHPEEGKHFPLETHSTRVEGSEYDMMSVTSRSSVCGGISELDTTIEEEDDAASLSNVSVSSRASSTSSKRFPRGVRDMPQWSTAAPKFSMEDFPALGGSSNPKN